MFLLSACAGQLPPSGGPTDTTSPTIIRTVPDSNAIHIKDNRIELEFSEYIDRRSLEESIFISPYVGDLEFDWGTTDVRVNFSQPLKENTTYVVNVGTDVVDLRAKNRMAAGYTLAFSTGDSIDQGLISGRVFDEKSEGVMIFAYVLANYDPDTLNPSAVKPDYITQTGKNGLFRLSNVALGRYRVIAVRDEYRNLLYDKQIDQFGVTVGDTTLTYERPGVSDLWYRLSVEDTTKPFVTNVRALDVRRIQVRFSEPIDSLSFEKASLVIVDTLDLRRVPIVLSSLSRSQPSLVDLITETKMDSGRAYRLRADRVLDRAGNIIDTTNNSMAFEGVGTPDTTRAVPTVLGVPDSIRGAPHDQSFVIRFSEPVVHQPLQHEVILRDSVRVVVPSGLQWLNATDLRLTPNIPLQSKAWYQISVLMDSVQDYGGNPWKDSIWAVAFQTIDLRTTGTIEGVVMDTPKSAGHILVTASSVDLTPAREKTIRLEEAGSFTMEQLPEGKYALRAFRDSDSSGTYSYGRPFPFVPSERFTIASDTVKVRARWGVEGVMLKFK